MVWKRLLLESLLLLLLRATVTSATLRIYQGRITSSGGSYEQVEGVAVLNINSGTNHVFDCLSTNVDADSLSWEKAEGVQRFPVSTQELEIDGVLTRVRRLGLTNAGYNDAGIYTCTGGGEMMSLNITGGATAVCPVESTVEVILGQTAELQVYVAGDPPIASSEIVWRKNDDRVEVDSRVSLTNSNKRLLIRNTGLGDSGTYRIDIRRRITALQFRTLASTTIEFDIHVGVAIASNPVSTSALEHASVALTCVFTGNPSPTITWEREGLENLPVETRRVITTTSMSSQNGSTYFVANSTFTIRSVLYEDQGRYRCVATNTLTGEVQRSDSSEYAELTITPRLQLTAQRSNTVDNGLVTVSSGSYVEIECSGSGALTWESSSEVTIPLVTAISTSINVHQTRDSTRNIQRLVIQSFSPADIALYTCRTDLIVNGISFAESVYISSSDPVVYIPEETIHAASSTVAMIRATVYSSDISNLSFEWYHNGRLINIASDTRYSESVEGSLHTLTIERVEADVLGLYQAVITVGAENRTDTVQLVFPDPPTASVMPNSLTVLEGSNATIRCLAGGTRPIVLWSLPGNMNLPNGVMQVGSDLFIPQVARQHSNQYKCVVSNDGGRVISTAILTVNYAPVALIIREGTTETSRNQVLRVVAEDGDSPPTFACSANAVPTPILMWEGQNGGVMLPNDVSLMSVRDNLALAWGRALRYTDSGNYTCVATNSAGEMLVRLELLVRRSPAITSIIPTPPVTSSSSSSSSLMVPPGHTGNVVTCAAVGWPTPTIQWIKTAGNLSGGRVVSNSEYNANPGSVSARLRWVEGFQESDAGNYTCMVQASDSDAVSSKVVELELLTTTLPSSAPMTCSMSSQETSFQVRVLGTECETWGDDRRAEIGRSFMNELVNTINAECRNCTVTAQDIEVTGVPTCSEQKEKAVIFRGVVTTESLSRTQDIFCTLSRWQKSGPFVRVDNDFGLVDRTCTIELTSLAAQECSSVAPAPTESFPLVIVIAAASGGVVLLLFILLVCCLCCCCYFKSSKKSKEKVTPRNPSHSAYERTQHHPDGSVSLVRYTDRVNPETPTSPTSLAGNENLYSTLNRAEMDDPRPHYTPDTEMEQLRKNSRALLVGDNSMVDGRESSLKFQERVPEPYQMAVRSREDLCNAGISAEGERSSNTKRYEFGHRRKLTQTLSSGAVPGAPRGNISATNPLMPYEQVDRNHGANEFSDSAQPAYNIRSGTMPMRGVASSGQVMRGMPPGVVPGMGFRRYTSAVESRGLAGSESTRLNQEERGAALPQRTRGVSVSSLTPNHGHQLPRLEKHNSVTNYSKDSPSSSDITKLPVTFTPTSEGPPPYREAASPYTPSESSSLVENGAYGEVSSPIQMTSAHDVAATRGSLNIDKRIPLEEQPWYHNTSDFSIHANEHQNADPMLPGTPQSSSGGYQKNDDQRRLSESPGDTHSRVSRFSLPPSNEPYSSLNHMDRNHLPKMPAQPPSTHFTVMV